MSLPKLIASLASAGLPMVLAASAVAQQYQIQYADYGFGNQRVDVTQRLRDLARTNTTFRMGNSTFGIDPSPGNKKTLRIHARAPNGQSRMFEYREGSVVDGAQFSGWSGGQWGNKGGEYQILRALYGTPERNVDVTQRLRELARSNSFFRMGNDTFGVDPARGQVKTLRIWARGPNGRNQMFEYREKSIVDGSKFSGWGGGNWGNPGWNGGWNGTPGPPAPPGRPPTGGNQSQLQIISAMYGAPGRNRDVSARLRSMIRNGRLSTVVSNANMGIDPAPGTPKTLWLTYSSGGRSAQQQKTVPENGQLTIP